MDILSSFLGVIFVFSQVRKREVRKGKEGVEGGGREGDGKDLERSTFYR